MEKRQGVTRLARDFDYLSIEERRECDRERVLEEKSRRTFEQMVHACQCQIPSCKSVNCRAYRQVFIHDGLCRLRVDGGCNACKLMWNLFRHHAHDCKESSTCSVPHCRELKLCFVTITLDDVLHSSRCQTPLCEYSNCSKAKELFYHGRICATGANGGCYTCKKMWRILRRHAKNPTAVYLVAGT